MVVHPYLVPGRSHAWRLRRRPRRPPTRSSSCTPCSLEQIKRSYEEEIHEEDEEMEETEIQEERRKRWKWMAVGG